MEMKTLRRIVGRTKWNRIANERIKKENDMRRYKK